MINVSVNCHRIIRYCWWCSNLDISQECDYHSSIATTIQDKDVFGCDKELNTSSLQEEATVGAKEFDDVNPSNTPVCSL